MASLASSFATLRMNQRYIKNQLDHLQWPKGDMYSCANIGVPFAKCSVKLYMVPFKQFSGLTISRSFAMDRSLESDGKHRKKRATSGVLGPTSSQSQDLERQLDGLFNEVKILIKTGNEDDALDLLQANYSAVKEQLDSGAQGLEEAAVLDIIALGYMALGDLRTVGSIMDTLHKIVDGLQDEEMFLDSILMHMGSMHAKLENFQMSISFYRRSLEIMERKYGNRSSFLCTPLLALARVLGTNGKTAEAVKTYEHIITLLESIKGDEGEELAVPLSELGNLLRKEGRAKEAENQFNRVLKIFMKSYGEKDGRVGMAMCSLAQVKCAKGEVNEAIDLYKNAIQILVESKYMELYDKSMEKMRIDLAELLHVVGRREEGRALLQECLFISKKFNGKDHPSLIPHLVNLATSYSRSKNFAESERLLRISLQIAMKNVPNDDPSITFPMLHLAVTLFKLQRDEEAERLALDVLRIREKAFGEESLPVGEALDCLVSIQSRLEKDDSELLKLLKRVLKIQEKAFGSDSQEVMETLKKNVHYMDRMGMKNEKYPLEKRLTALRNKYKEMVMY